MTGKYNCPFVQQKLEEGGQLIDVRSAFEFNRGALNGAVNMPIDKFHHLMNKIDSEKPVLLYCRTGARSGAVKNLMEQQGFNQVHNIGGINQFISCHLPDD